jgi:hypothetical protein
MRPVTPFSLLAPPTISALHSADTGATGASELTGGGYVRQPFVFTTWSAGGTSNTAAIAVPNAGTTAAAYFSRLVGERPAAPS